jgi:hypothetical protein
LFDHIIKTMPCRGMACHHRLWPPLDCTTLSILFLSCLHGVSSDRRYFTSLFTLGDSYIDAGNFVIMAGRMVPPVPVWHDKPPYGMTFFGYPTGRLSDGRIITDFIGMLSDLMPCTKR